jgi:HK97 family phage major capsid protein
MPPFDTSSIGRNDAQALIPEEVANQIFQDLPKKSVCLSKFRQVTMSRKQQRQPVLSLLPHAYFRDGDNGRAQMTKIAWANKFLNAEELVVFVPIPKVVLDDAEFDIWGETRPRLVEALGATVDAAILFGDGKPASWPAAIVDAAHAAGQTFVRGSVVGNKLDLDVNAIMGQVEEDGYDVNGFAARKTIKSALRGLRTNQYELLFQPSLQAGTPDTLYGESIEYVQNGGWDNDKADMISGDWMQGVIGMRKDITWDIFKEATLHDGDGNVIYNLAQDGMVALMVALRLAWQVPNPVNRMNPDDNTRYPFSVLRPAGFVES